MILTDLNIDCLEAIVRYLELGDLVNAADSNKQILHASRLVFVRKYRQYKFIFNGKEANIFRDDEIAILESHEDVEACIKNNRGIYGIIKKSIFITVLDQKFALQTLRNFGDLISRIEFSKDNQQIHDYVDEYCNETLICIQMGSRFFQKPFTNVKSVKCNLMCVLEKNICLEQTFPNMRELTLESRCSESIHNGLFVKHCRNLEYFKFTRYIDPWSFALDNECVEVLKSFLRLNTQLKHLSLDCIDNMDISIFEVISKFPNLENLELNVKHVNFLKFFDGKKITFRNVKHFIIAKDFNCLITRNTILKEIPFLFDHLESLEVNGHTPFGRYETAEIIYKFVSNHSFLKKLKLEYFEDSLEWSSRLAKSMPDLEELTVIRGYELSIDTIFLAIDQFKSLKYFCFEYCQKFPCEQLQSRLKYDWAIQYEKKIEFNIVTLKRLVS